MEEVCPVVKKGIKRDKYEQIMMIKYICQDENINNKCIFDSHECENRRSENWSEN
jgi:hypothetical protein